MTDEGSTDGSVMSTRNLVSMILLLWLTPHDASAQGRLDVAAIKSILVTSTSTEVYPTFVTRSVSGRDSARSRKLPCASTNVPRPVPTTSMPAPGNGRPVTTSRTVPRTTTSA